MGDRLGIPSTAGMGSVIDAPKRGVGSVKYEPLLVEVFSAGVHLR